MVIIAGGVLGQWGVLNTPLSLGGRGQDREGVGSLCEVIAASQAALPEPWLSLR